MRYIANILTNRKFDDYEFYNIVSRKEDLIDNIPTLVIGWEFTKTLYPNANITTWDIDNNTFWTFGNRERRQRYDELLIKFRNLAINRFIKNIKYKYINLLSEGFGGLEFLLTKCDDINVYINNDMVYVVTNSKDNDNIQVYGFSLKAYQYLGVDKKDIFKQIYASGANVITPKDEIPWEIKNNLKNCSYVIPCMY
jgi:hypothetical protein